MTTLELAIVGWALLSLMTVLCVLLSIRGLYLTKLYLILILLNLKSDSPSHQALRRFITGKIGAINKENIKINTPTSQIGIRGTDFTVTVDELGRSLVILLPDINGISSGEITVETAAGLVVLDKPYESTTTSVWESSPTKPITLDITLDLIDNMLIVTPPEEEEIVEDTSNIKRADLLDFNDLDYDALAEDTLADEDLEFTELDINFLDVNFFEDLLEVLEEVDGLRGGNEKKKKANISLKSRLKEH